MKRAFFYASAALMAAFAVLYLGRHEWLHAGFDAFMSFVGFHLGGRND